MTLTTGPETPVRTKHAPGTSTHPKGPESTPGRKARKVPRDADTWTRTGTPRSEYCHPPPASSLWACAGIAVRTAHANTNTSLPGGRCLLGLRPATHRARSVGLRPFALGAVAPLLRSPAVAPLVGTAAPLARGDGCPPRSVCDRRPTALLLASYACIRCVREDDDADPIASQMVPITMVLTKAQTPD